MKRYIAIMCMLLFAMIMLPGCSDSADTNNGGNAPASTAPATTEPPPQPEPTPAPEPAPAPAEEPAAADYTPELLVEPTMPARYGANDWEVRDQVISENPVDSEYLTLYNDFAYTSTAKVLANAKANRNFAPISLYYALAMTAIGADGNTYEEISGLLRLTGKEELMKQSGNLFRRLYTDNDVTKLTLANSIWLRDNFKVKDEFVSNAVSQFYAWIYSADFTNPDAGKAVAKWIAANTNGAIEPQITLDRDTMMLLINTVYFYDEWQENFAEEQTAKDKFTLADDSQADADFMHKTFGAKTYYKGDNFSRIDLALKGRGVMSFVLPYEGVNVNDFLTGENALHTAFEKGERDEAKVELYLPKFKFDSEFKLVEALQALGIKDAFNENANFKSLSDEDGLYISDIIQQSHIGVNENGVEAAAYTMVLIAKMSMPIELEKTVELKFNRPFIFSIKAENGAILFIGICDNPAL